MKVHHVAEGPEDGEVVVLAGSLGSDLNMWQPQVEPLVSAGYRVVRYDHRGHGETPVADEPFTLADLGGDVVELLDTLGVERAHLVGLSLGGMTGMWLASHEPSRVSKLVLCCTSALLGPRQMWEDRIRTVREQGMGQIADGGVQRWFTEPWRAANPERVREFHRMIAAIPAEGYIACCSVIADMDLRADLPSITAPTLVISCVGDSATPPDAHGANIAAAVPGARYEVVPDAAHLGNVEQPERFSELILEHLA